MEEDPVQHKLHLINNYGDDLPLQKEELEKYGITLSSSSHNQSQEKENESKKTSPKTSGFQESDEFEYNLSPNKLFYRDEETSNEFFCGSSPGYFGCHFNKDKSSSNQFSSGIHIWELIFPAGISGVEFGVQSVSTSKKYFRKFKTTTPRFVAVKLDADQQQIKYR